MKRAGVARFGALFLTAVIWALLMAFPPMEAPTGYVSYSNLGSGTVNSCYDIGSPDDYIDFTDDLVPSPVPPGGGTNYYINWTNGTDVGTLYYIIVASDGGSWNGLDYFQLQSWSACTGSPGTDADGWSFDVLQVQQPDLSVPWVGYSPGVPISGRPVTVTATVNNTGTAAATTFNVTLYVDNTYEAYTTIASLAAGGTTNVTFTWTPSGSIHTLNVTADSPNTTQESDETNNDNQTDVYADWPKWQRDAKNTGWTSEYGPTPAQYLPFSRAERFPMGGGYLYDQAQPVLSGDVLYLPVREDGVYAVNASNVTQVLGFNNDTFGAAYSIHPTLLVFNNTVFAQHLSKLYALNASNLNQTLSFYSIPEVFYYSSPSYYNGYIYSAGTNATGSNGRLHKFLAASVNSSAGHSSTGVGAGFGVYNSIAIDDDGTIYVGTYTSSNTTDGYIRAYNSNLGFIDAIRIGRMYYSSPIVYNHSVYAVGRTGASTYALHRLEIVGGTMYDRSSKTVSGNSQGSPVAYNGKIYIWNNTHVIAVHSMDVSNVLDSTPSIGSLYADMTPIIMNDTLYLPLSLSGSTHMRAYNASDLSQELGRIDLSSDITTFSGGMTGENNTLYIQERTDIGGEGTQYYIRAFRSPQVMQATGPASGTIVDRDSVDASTSDTVTLQVTLPETGSGKNVTFKANLTDPDLNSTELLLGSNLTDASGAAQLTWNPSSSYYAGNYTWWAEADLYYPEDFRTVHVYGGLNVSFRYPDRNPNSSYESGDTAVLDVLIRSLGPEADGLLSASPITNGTAFTAKDQWGELEGTDKDYVDVYEDLVPSPIPENVSLYLKWTSGTYSGTTHKVLNTNSTGWNGKDSFQLDNHITALSNDSSVDGWTFELYAENTLTNYSLSANVTLTPPTESAVTITLDRFVTLTKLENVLASATAFTAYDGAGWGWEGVTDYIDTQDEIVPGTVPEYCQYAETATFYGVRWTCGANCTNYNGSGYAVADSEDDSNCMGWNSLDTLALKNFNITTGANDSAVNGWTFNIVQNTTINNMTLNGTYTFSTEGGTWTARASASADWFFDGDSSRSFTVPVEEVAAPPSAGLPGRALAIEAENELIVTEADVNKITLDRGTSEPITILVENTGDFVLTDVVIEASGLPYGWVIITPSKIDSLGQNEVVEVKAYLFIPETAALGEYELTLTAHSFYVKSTYAAKVTITDECEPCPAAGPWSECVEGKQSRTNYRCGAQTDYECVEWTEEQECVVIPEEVVDYAPLLVFAIVLVGVGAILIGLPYWKK